jgi:hypothetical protein
MDAHLLLFLFRDIKYQRGACRISSHPFRSLSEIGSMAHPKKFDRFFTANL